MRSKTSIDNKLLIWLVNISFNYLCFCLLYACSCVFMCVCLCACTAHQAGLGINLHLGRRCCCTMQKVNVFSWGVACATFCLPQHDRSFFAFFIFASSITNKLFMCVEATETERETERRCRGGREKRNK